MISGSGPGSQSQVPDFDGMTVAAKCLVRLCEQGNLTVAAELIQAKADLNMPEPEIGVTPLIAAANAGHLDVCKYLMLGQHKKKGESWRFSTHHADFTNHLLPTRHLI